MKVVLDACTIINLINGEVLDKIIMIQKFDFCIIDDLLDQELLNNSQKIIIEALLEQGRIELIESDVTVSEFSSIQSKYNIGAGETECICLCKRHQHIIATDDRKARLAADIELGNGYLIGSLYLLRESVRIGILNCSESISSYTLMRKEGGFLPKNIDQRYLCT